MGKQKDKNQCKELEDKTDMDPIRILRSPTFNKVYGTRVLPMKTEFDFRALITNEKIRDDEQGEEFYITDLMLILTPVSVKEFHKNLGKLIKEWEKENGVIKERPKNLKYSAQEFN